MNPQLKQRQWDEVEEQEDNRMQLNINDLQHDRCWTGSYAVSHSALWLLSPNSLDQRQQSCDRKRCLCGHQKKTLFFFLHGICPLLCSCFSCSFSPFFSPQRIASLPRWGTSFCKMACACFLGSAIRRASEMCTFACHVPRVDETTACTPRTWQMELEGEKGKQLYCRYPKYIIGARTRENFQSRA